MSLSSLLTPLQTDLRYLFDTLYSNRKLSQVAGYFSMSDIETLTLGHFWVSELPLTEIIAIASSRGILSRYWIQSLSTPEDPVYIWRANPNILVMNPTNIQLFKGYCPGIPTCLLSPPGTYSVQKGNGMLSVRDDKHGGLYYGAYTNPLLDPPSSPESVFNQPMQVSRMCHGCSGGITLLPPPITAAPCVDSACPDLPVDDVTPHILGGSGTCLSAYSD